MHEHGFQGPQGSLSSQIAWASEPCTVPKAVAQPLAPQPPPTQPPLPGVTHSSLCPYLCPCRRQAAALLACTSSAHAAHEAGAVGGGV